MALVPWRREWNPFAEFEKLQDEINKVFEDFPLASYKDADSPNFFWAPAIDVYNTPDSYIIKADLPGMKRENIDVAVEGDILVLKGEKKEEKEEKGKDFLKRERMIGSFSRTLKLPGEVDAEKIAASYKDGVLEINLPKKEEAKPKQIKVDVK